MIQIVFLEPKTSGNVGAIARVMANFNFKNLILIDPQCNHLDEEASKRSKHAKYVLEKAQILKTIQELKLISDYVVGTTSVLGRDYNIPRVPINAEEFGKKVAEIERVSPELKISILIGREGDGMRNEELEACDIVVSIPTSKKYPTMNVSHAATILMYELFKHSKKEKLGQHIKLAKKEDKERLLAIIDEKMQILEFTTDQKKKTQRTTWRKVIGKSNPTKRELMALFGFMKKIK